MDRVRAMRIIIYDGDRDWVENTIRNSILRVRNMGKNNKIYAFTVETFPEIIKSIDRTIDESTDTPDYIDGIEHQGSDLET